MSEQQSNTDAPLSTLNAKWTGVPGTWGESNESKWWTKDSAFSQHVKKLGLDPLRARDFYWSTDINGASLFSIFSASKHSDWKAAGASLEYYFDGVTVKDRNIIAHSHGLQVVLYACSLFGLEINTLTSVSGPVRKDMAEVAAKARPKIGYWTHIHSDSSDRMQWFGELFDGALKIVRAHPLADINFKIPKVGHSDILYKPELFKKWDPIVYPMYQAHGT